MNGSIAPWRGRNGAVLFVKGMGNGSGHRKMELCVHRAMRVRDDNGSVTNGVHAMSAQLSERECEMTEPEKSLNEMTAEELDRLFEGMEE